MKNENSTFSKENIIKEKIQNETSTKDSQINKHKQIPSCMNNCIKWTLKAYINNDNQNKENNIGKQYEFSGKSVFFKKLEASILNVLQNNSSNNNNNYNNILNKMEKESKNQLCFSKLKFPSSPSSIRDVLNINFPIDNSEFNFMIIDANLGISENLNNIFFLEFDLDNGNDNNNLDLRTLNDECVEKEINCILNGTIHDVPLFKSDLLFSVEYRKFIKSIQFRLQNYKNYHFENKKRNNWKRKRMNNDKNNITQMTFFAKILCNINIGIQFTRPFLGENEVFHTNFNSVVNSDIKIDKIYLELCIPKMFINNNINLSSVLNKEIEKIEKEKNESETETNISESNKNLLNNNNKPLSPSILIYQNDFDRMISSQHNSPPLIRNKFTLGKFKYNNFYSPNYINNQSNFINNNNSPNSFNPNYLNHHSPNSFNPNYINNNSGFSSPIIYTPLSPMMQNPFLLNLGNPINTNNNNNNGQSKFSENIYEKLKENPLSKMNRQTIYNNSQTPIIMKVNNDEMIRNIPIQPFFSPRGRGNINNSSSQNNNNNNNINNNFYSMTPMIQTIHKRILDWEKNNSMNNDANNNKYDFSRLNNPHNTLINMKNIFLNYYEGKTNLDIFINSITPIIQTQNYLKMNLISFFKCYKYISLFQLKNTYYLYGDLIFIYYSITLSSMNIVISKKELIDKFTDFLISNNRIKCKEDIKENEEIIINEFFSNILIRYNSDKIYITFYENRPWHSRPIFIQQIKEITKIIPLIKDILIEEIDFEDSYYSIFYHPIKTNKPFMTFTSFLVFYKFKKENTNYNNDKKSDKLSLMGLLPIKFDTKLFLTKISINGFINIPIPPFSPFFPNYSIDTLNLRNLINGVLDNKIIRHTSFDYDYYMKTSNFNYK